MTTRRVLGLFAVAYVVLFGIGALIGKLVSGGDEPKARAGERGATGTTPGVSAGLAMSSGGSSLDVGPSRLGLTTAPFRFSIAGPDGRALRTFDSVDGARMHLFVVPQDLETIQHIVPVQISGGRWAAPVRVPKPGPYRVYADFARGGLRQTLGIQLSAAGTANSPIDRKPSTSTRSGPFRVALTSGSLGSGRDENLTFTITRDDGAQDRPAPLAGRAYGYLVAVRYGDFALSHAKPTTVDDTKRKLGFRLRLDEPGRYRLFLQFRTKSSLLTAGITADVSR